MNITSAESIKDFQTSLNRIYLDKNKDRSPEYIYAYLARNSSYLSRSVLRSGNVESSYIKTLSWLLAFSNALNIDLQDAFLKKFPKVCPYCLGITCICVQNHKKPENKLPAYKIKKKLEEHYTSVISYNSGKSFTIDDAVEVIARIYPANKVVWSVHGSFYHFTRIYEELGEIHEAYTSFRKDPSRKINVEEELADFTAWLLSTWEICMKEKSLKESLINYYSQGCPVCMKEVCICGDYSDRKEAVIDLALLESLKAEVAELNDASDKKIQQISELVSSIDTALQSKSTTDAKRVLTQAKDTLDDVSSISNSVTNIGENAGKIATLIGSIYSLIERISSAL